MCMLLHTCTQTHISCTKTCGKATQKACTTSWQNSSLQTWQQEISELSFVQPAMQCTGRHALTN